MNKNLLQAVVLTLEDIQSIRNTISGINAEDLSLGTRALLRSIFAQCDTTDSILEEVLVWSCNASAATLAAAVDNGNGRDIVLSGIVR